MKFDLKDDQFLRLLTPENLVTLQTAFREQPQLNEREEKQTKTLLILYF